MYMVYNRFENGIPKSITRLVKSKEEGIQLLLCWNETHEYLGEDTVCKLIEFKDKVDRDERVMVVNGGYI